jgi:hypothetical protein
MAHRVTTTGLIGLTVVATGAEYDVQMYACYIYVHQKKPKRADTLTPLLRHIFTHTSISYRQSIHIIYIGVMGLIGSDIVGRVVANQSSNEPTNPPPTTS